MNKEYIQNRIEQVAYDGATDGYNQAVIEREAEKLATEIVNYLLYRLGHLCRRDYFNPNVYVSGFRPLT